MKIIKLIILIGVLSFSSVSQSDNNDPIDKIAESYVKLILALGAHDKNYVDAYYGPEEWQLEVKSEPKSHSSGP